MTQIDKVDSVRSFKESSTEGMQPQHTERLQPDGEKFQALMKEQNSSSAFAVKAEQMRESHPLFNEPRAEVPSPEFEQLDSRENDQDKEEKGEKKDHSRGEQDVETISGHMRAQAKGMVSTFDSARNRLESLEKVGGAIPPSYQTVIRNHLHHIDDRLQVVASQVGVEQPLGGTSPTTDKRLNPVKEFLNYLTHGQRQLEGINHEVSRLSQTKEMPIQQMMALQYKMNRIQQDIELFSSLLNKLLESFKTLMQVQV